MVVRFEHPDGRKTYRSGQAVRRDRVRWGLPRELRVPYRLGRLRKAIDLGLPIIIAEGEKSCDAINDLDVALRRHTATTLPGGSAQWNSAPEPHRWFEGAEDIRIIIDRDVAGQRWAADVIASLARLSPPPQIRLLQSRTREAGDDVVDHLLAGFGLADLMEITND